MAGDPRANFPFRTRIEPALLNGGRLFGVRARRPSVGVGQSGVFAERRLDGLGHVVQADEALDGAHLEPAPAARLRTLGPRCHEPLELQILRFAYVIQSLALFNLNRYADAIS